MENGLMQKAAAEFIGTFMLVLVGCGAILSDAQSGGALGHLGVSLCFGLVIMVMIYATGHISGAHFNPAVTIAFASVGRFSWSQVPVYVASQIIAALLGALVLGEIFVDGGSLGATTSTLPLVGTLGLELLLTFALMFVITAVATDARAEGAMAGLAIGGTVAMAALMGGPLTGASMNPARSLGPALISGQLNGLWPYLVSPVVGAILGAAVYRWMQQCRDLPGSDAGGCC